MPRLTIACGGSRVTSRPSKRMLPDLALSTPETVRSNVVLPAPFAPTMASSDKKSRVFRLRSRHQLFPQVFAIVPEEIECVKVHIAAPKH